MDDFRWNNINFLLFSARFICDACNRGYRYLGGLKSHQKFECGKNPQFECPVSNCSHRTKHKSNMNAHVKRIHGKLWWNKLHKIYCFVLIYFEGMGCMTLSFVILKLFIQNHVTFILHLKAVSFHYLINLDVVILVWMWS